MCFGTILWAHFGQTGFGHHPSAVVFLTFLTSRPREFDLEFITGLITHHRCHWQLRYDAVEAEGGYLAVATGDLVTVAMNTRASPEAHSILNGSCLSNRNSKETEEHNKKQTLSWLCQANNKYQCDYIYGALIDRFRSPSKPLMGKNRLFYHCPELYLLMFGLSLFCCQICSNSFH